MINKDDDTSYDNEGEFNSFKFNVFKFPDEPTGKALHKLNWRTFYTFRVLVSFECTITVCHEETAQCFLASDSSQVDGTCNGASIWSDSASGRKKSSTENDQRDYKLTATLNFQRK